MKPILGSTRVSTLILASVFPLIAAADYGGGGQHGAPGHSSGGYHGGAGHYHGGRHGDIRHFGGHDYGVWRGGHWNHGWHNGRSGWWWVAGGLWYFYPVPVYPYPNPYVPPLVVEGSPPSTVVIQAPLSQSPPPPGPEAVPQSPQNWYYCESAKGYYPYVTSCPSGWQMVPASPPEMPQ